VNDLVFVMQGKSYRRSKCWL